MAEDREATKTRTEAIRLGLVGIGKIARDQHVPAIANDRRFELVATASPCDSLDGVPAYRTIEEMLGAGHDIDAVTIATPPQYRAAIALTAIEAGLHVMLEKPPAASVAEAAILEERAAANNITLFASWHSREAAGVSAARQWLADREIRQVDVHWQEDIRRWHPGQDWILAEGGNGVFDPAINAFSIMAEILPAALEVQSAMLAVPSNRQAPISATVGMRCGMANVTAVLDFLHAGEPRWDIHVETDRGSISLREGGRVLEVAGSTTTSRNDEYPRLYERFADLIRTGQSLVDLAPLQLVEDATAIASTRQVGAFEW